MQMPKCSLKFQKDLEIVVKVHLYSYFWLSLTHYLVASLKSILRPTKLSTKLNKSLIIFYLLAAFPVTGFG